jgi:(S)-2-hydroxyglutarate dehydrogenase
VNRIDCALVGGGIVGLATAWTLLQKQPGRAITVFEKEKAVAQHQTSHNSGVIHSGLYYKPGSEKARTCVEGARRMLAFCKEHAIPHDVCGKLVIATYETELPALAELHRRAQANGVTTREIGPDAMRDIEPHCTGVKALHVPGAAIVSYAAVAQKMAELIRGAGGSIELDAQVVAIHCENAGWRVLTQRGEFHAKTLINCGGLFSDRIAQMK